MRRLLATLILVLTFVGTALAAVPPMPDLQNDYEYAMHRVVGPCPNVVAVAFEAADGSTKDDPNYPLMAYFLVDESGSLGRRPFIVILFDSQEGRLRVFWIDYNRDGVADEFGDQKRLEEVLPSMNVCELAQRVK